MPYCRINFRDIQNNIIFSGQLLRGTVEIRVDEETTVKTIFLRISGKTVYRKYRGSSLFHERGNRVTKKTKKLFDTEIGLPVRENNGNVHLSVGVHNYPFEFQLPSDLPSTIKAEFGYRIYKVRVYFRSLLKKKKAGEELFVVKGLDLNAIPSLRMPLIGEIKKPISMNLVPFIHSSGTVIIKAKAPMGGYTPYQTINLEILIINQSNKPISECTVRLVKHVKCYLKGFADWASVIDYDHIVLAEYKHRGCGSMREEQIHTDICIPATQPTDEFSDMIAVTYSIEITGMIENFMWNDLTLDLPITIGSVPLMPK